ncbi:PLP-dependent aminotransferase family protein [Anaerotardibacter muris]|uniref:aminotransferase-like domain-containing protein n=1 Tax=Anaerotardibacter muris TaxID=2941505 RepID=UPI00203E98C9|nr:PLP-dependent aminotransferase family protein [Anaerotardibacter muris]
MPSAHLKFDHAGDKVASRVTKMRSSAVRDLFAAASRSDIISLSGGMPDVSLLPPESLQTAVQAALGDERAIALQYGSTNGRAETREMLATLVRDLGIRCKEDDVLITTGAQEALDLIAKTFVDPGDIIITEGPTYLGALQAFSAYEPNIICIPFDEDGMRMDLLEEKLEELGKGAVKFLYTIPNFQNPGGVTMNMERRHRLLELAEEYDFLVIEDDPYGRLRYDGGHMIPLRALSDDVIYLGTVSKTFAPGLRTGWIIAPRDILAKINLVKQGTDLCGSAMDQVIVEHYFTDTPWQAVLQTFIQTYKERRDAMLEALDEFFPEEATWTHPAGGFFVWVTLPDYVDTDSMLAVALENGVTYTPGSGFYPNGTDGKNSMRLAFCFETPENLREAIRRLANVIEDRLELYRAFLEAGAI